MSISAVGTTQINDLPISNSVGIVNNISGHPTSSQQPIQPIQDLVSNNIKNEITPVNHMNNNGIMNNNANINNYNELIGQIQHADKMGATKLPSRDIPQNQNVITMDENTKPNFIPNTDKLGEATNDYIANYETANDVLEKYDADEEYADRIEKIYRDLQTPILLAVLYFLFNLPIVRKQLHRFIPNLFSSDGNPNLYGYTFNSIIFAGLFFFVNKLLSFSISIA